MTNPFLDPDVERHYRELYELAQYECRHAFDPELTWTRQEEKKLVRKLDWHVCLWVCIMFFALQVDRGNLNQAVSDDMLQDLGLTTTDFNYGHTIFKVSFLLAELPSQLVSLKLGPDRWIPTQITLWSVVAAAQAGLQGRSGFFVCRALLGVLEGGFVPVVLLYLSYFYTSKELPIRLSFFWTAMDITTIITSLFAFALLHLSGVAGLQGWRWLFLIEGILTGLIGMASFFMMPASAVQTKTWFRPNGWFTDRQVSIAVNRLLRDDPGKGSMHNRMAITPKRLWQSVVDYDMWPLYALGLICFIPTMPPRTYLTLTLRRLGFNPFITNLLVIPTSVLAIFTLLGITWISEQLNERTYVAMLQNIWMLPCLIALRWWTGVYKDAWGTYALVSVLLASPSCQAILAGWVSSNSGSVRTRSVSSALYNMFFQLSGIFSANIYSADDEPLYHRGNSVLIGLNFLALALFLFAKGFYLWRNKTKERKWNAMAVDEKADYLQMTKDQGNKRLDFRFKH